MAQHHHNTHKHSLCTRVPAVGKTTVKFQKADFLHQRGKAEASKI